MGTYYELCVKDMSTILPAEEYIRRFRDAETFMRRCMECRNYNRTWGCPPYDHDIEEELGHYNSVMITVTVINLGGNRIFLTEWDSVTAPQRERLEKMLLEKEKELGERHSDSEAHAGTAPQVNVRDGTACHAGIRNLFAPRLRLTGSISPKHWRNFSILNSYGAKRVLCRNI